MNGLLMTVVTIIMAAATVALAIFAWQSNKLSKEIKRTNDLRETEDKEFKQQVTDLYQAIVVAEIISTPNMIGQYDAIIKAFKSHYKGKTPIFKE